MPGPARDIIVVGASTGGVEALQSLVGGLPPSLPAAVFVTLHIPPHSPIHLDAILLAEHHAQRIKRTEHWAEQVRHMAGSEGLFG